MTVDERSLEEAADELGRLDTVAEIAPRAFTIALRSRVLVELGLLGEIPPADFDAALAAVVAAEGDAIHDAPLPTAFLHWRELLLGEERRVRAGATLTSQRFAVVVPALATYPDRPRLEAIWREAGTTRPVLERALATAAWSLNAALGEATAALVLVAGGRAERVRLLPFADLPADAREEARAAWRVGEETPWRLLALGQAARRARALRRALESAWRAIPDETASLDELGRAAITARLALALLRDRLVATVPTLAEALELSRPAAAGAVERLMAMGLAREVTGRARDRVFAYAPALGVAAVLPAPAPVGS